MIKKFLFVIAVVTSLVMGNSYQSPDRALAQTSDPVFVGAGDISNCGNNNDEATAKLLDGISGTVFTLGDNVYPDGTTSQFADCYGPTWGRHKNRTRPSPGNHDYHTPGASGYYNYFGAAAGDPAKGYYSYNLGAWHIISLNSEVGYAAGSAQEQWLRSDLAANKSVCTLAYWHHPRFSSGNHGNSNRGQAFWQALYEYGADVVLNGHDHTYERFAPQSPSAKAEPNRGIREFVVGTGGAGLYPFPVIQPNSEVRNNTTFGVLKLTLHATSYDWQFVPVAGKTFTDSGTGNCVSTTGTVAMPTRTQTAIPTATYTATPSKTFTPLPPTATSTATAVASTAASTSTGNPASSVTPAQTSTGLPASSPTTAPPSTTQPPALTPDTAFTSSPTPASVDNRTPTPPSISSSDLISTDNFESGSFSAWTGKSTDNGDLSLSASAALVGSTGLQAVINDENSLYLADDRPNAETRYRARFYFDPNSISMATGDAYNIFNGFVGTSTAVMRVEFGRSSSTYVMRGSVLDDSSTWVRTNWFPITDTPHYIEIEWRAKSSGANNGGITVWLDGTQQVDLTGVDNDTRRIDRVRLGAVTGIDPGTGGTFFLDAFESRRLTYIGPAGSAPLPTSTLVPAASATSIAIPTSTAPQSSTSTSTAVAISTSTSTAMAVSATAQSSTATSTAISASPTPQSATTPQSGTVKMVYGASNEDIANPERGFMKQSSIFPDQPLDPNKIRALQSTDTLVWVYFRLDNYRDRSLDQTALNNITSAFTLARDRGLKLVIRFVYNPGPGSTNDPNLAKPDAPIELVLQHIRTLQPILAANADVIAVIQVGFVGHWGEWHSTKYLHPLTYRKAIVDALLDALPADRMLMLRYPRYKEIFYQGPLTSQEAFTGTDRSRIGHHNDCFLRDQDDGGTYKSTTPQLPKHTSTYCDGQDAVSCWKDFIAQESQFTPVGGEACQYNPPRTDCPNTLLEMDMLHWSFINNGYRREVLDGWTSGGCMNTIRRSLGYRLTLKEAFIPPNVKPGGALSLNVRLSNDGFAAMFNPRPLFVVLQGAGGRYEIPVSNIDPRRWSPGQEHTFTINVNLPANVAPGTYKLGLWLPDAYTSLRGKPAYSVRFANTNVWEAATGINILTTDFKVVP